MGMIPEPSHKLGRIDIEEKADIFNNLITFLLIAGLNYDSNLPTMLNLESLN